MSKTLVIYHRNCLDGFGAAWAVWNCIGDADVEYLACGYDDDTPDVTGLDVIFVDFSFKRRVMHHLIEQCKSMVVLDHHASAERELDGIFNYEKAQGVFDMENSGAMLAWKWFNPNSNIPGMLELIEDRDLWRFDYDDTKAVCAALYSYEFSFPLWSELSQNIDGLIDPGLALLRSQDKDVQGMLKYARDADIAGHIVPVLNCHPKYSSDVGYALAKDKPFAATYSDTSSNRVFSLRSSETGVDVSKIAEIFGGGGHKHAAGFSMGAPELNISAP